MPQYFTLHQANEALKIIRPLMDEVWLPHPGPEGTGIPERGRLSIRLLTHRSCRIEVLRHYAARPAASLPA